MLPSRAAIAVAACVSGPLVAQPVTRPVNQPAPDPAKVREALDELHGDKLPTEARLDAIVGVVLDAGPAGLRELSDRLRAADKARDARRRDRLFTLVGHVGFRRIGAVQKSGMVYAGQYAELKPLMPHIGDFYLRLLLDTPEWFPITDRWKVVPAVRDLFPKGPDRETMDQIAAMAVAEREPEHLRVRLEYALAQWGRRELVKTRLRALEKTAAGDDVDLALTAMRDLAAIHYGIRDYMSAAIANKAFLARAEGHDFALSPENYYNSACCYSLIGDRRTAMEFVEKALALNNSSKIDDSVRLKRSLFERDPEIANARKDPRYQELLDRAFGPDKATTRKNESGR